MCSLTKILPNQKETYLFQDMDRDFLVAMEIYYGSEVWHEVENQLASIGFFTADDINQQNRRHYFIYFDSQELENYADKPDPFRAYVEDFVMVNVPFIDHQNYSDVENTLENTTKPVLLDMIFVKDNNFTLSVVHEIQDLLIEFYSDYYPIENNGNYSYSLEGSIMHLPCYGALLEEVVKADITEIVTAAEKAMHLCEGWSLYDYIDFSQETLIAPLDVDMFLDGWDGRFVIRSRVNFLNKVWAEVITIKKSGKMPLLYCSGSLNKEKKYVMAFCCVVEKVRIALNETGYIADFLNAYSHLTRKANVLLEDNIKFLSQTPDSFFMFKNHTFFLGTKSITDTGLCEDAVVTLGMVKLKAQSDLNTYVIDCEKEIVQDLNLSNLPNNVVLMSYKDLNSFSVVDLFAKDPLKTGKMQTITVETNKKLSKLFWDYEELLTKNNSNYALKENEFLSLQNCMFLEIESELYLARILEYNFKAFWDIMRPIFLEDDSLESHIFTTKVETHQLLYTDCLPLYMLADYDCSLTFAYDEDGTRYETNTVPYISVDGLVGCILMLSGNKYTSTNRQELFECNAQGIDAIAVCKFDSSANLPYETNKSIKIWDCLSRTHMRRLGYLTALGGDNIVLSPEPYVLNCDIFKSSR